MKTTDNIKNIDHSVNIKNCRYIQNLVMDPWNRYQGLRPLKYVSSQYQNQVNMDYIWQFIYLYCIETLVIAITYSVLLFSECNYFKFN